MANSNSPLSVRTAASLRSSSKQRFVCANSARRGADLGVSKTQSSRWRKLAELERNGRRRVGVWRRPFLGARGWRTGGGELQRPKVAPCLFRKAFADRARRLDAVGLGYCAQLQCKWP